MNARTRGIDEHLLRELSPQVLAAVVRRYRDFAIAEEAVQEALLSAAQTWPAEGTPQNPRAWLIQVAARRVTDALRSDGARKRRETELAVELGEPEVAAPDSDFEPEKDDTVLLLFMCCHPALTRASAIALTLRAVGGLTTAEIARAFLVPEATMAQRISRAKQLIAKSGVGFVMPSETERDERLSAVLHVLYLIFNEGYAASGGENLQRVDLATEAIRLTRELARLLPGEAEVLGLLALMRLTDARKSARSNEAGELIPLDEQDRSRWDRLAIEEGVALLSRALPSGRVGPYQLQGAIAACHDEAARAEDTDWPQILALYELLEALAPNPMVTLNKAVALAMVRGPRVGLALVETLEADARLAGHHRLVSVQAHLHERAGDTAQAIALYHRAASLTANLAEQHYLMLRAARLREAGSATKLSS